MQHSKTQQDELANFLEGISDSIRLQVIAQIFTKMLQNHNETIIESMSIMKSADMNLRPNNLNDLAAQETANDPLRY